VDASNRFDLAVIGSGPAGQKGAIAAAKLKKRVAMIDREDMIGGVSLHSGTIPSKTVREAILYLTGFRQRSFYGTHYTLKENISIADLALRVNAVKEREMAVVKDQLRRNGITVVHGAARFLNPHRLEVRSEGKPQVIEANHVLIACGTRPAQDPSIPVDGKGILVADQLSNLEAIPKDVIIVGAGVIGLEFASMFTALGVEVTLIEQRPTILDFVDHEIVEALMYHMRRQGAIFRLGEKVTEVGVDESGRVRARMESGKRVGAETLLYTVGRQTNADTLGLEAAGLAADARGRITVNKHFQTAVPHIYAAGDVIGFPALASTSMEQGRLASCHMFGAPSARRELMPYGIYTVPEISMVGRTERELTQASVPYEVGIAKYEELARGQIAGDRSGLLKLLFDPETLQLLGVHVIGDNATEIVHIGECVLAFGGTVEYFRDTVFNYPTYAEAYKVAALDGLNKLC
jgi:NAD(P) transhydrogenase